MKKVLILAGVVIFLLMGTAAALRMTDESRTRGLIAQSWSSNDLQIHAEGVFNQTLVATPINDGEVPCVYFIRAVTEDAGLTKRMSSFGFTEIQCGDIKASIQ